MIKTVALFIVILYSLTNFYLLATNNSIPTPYVYMQTFGIVVLIVSIFKWL